MIRITFKNIGQGDSIILEWKKNGQQKIGIIDCNKVSGSNPTLNYIKEKNIKEISFLLLSHPHFDHFSGFVELIEHCIENKIRIGYFLHTSNNTKNYWMAALDSTEANTEILRLFNIIRTAEVPLGMKRHNIQAGTIFNDINLDNEYFIKIIAPTSEHLDNFAKNIDNQPFEEEAGNKPNANWLATVLKIYSNKHGKYILLTSDAKKETMFYDKRKPHEYESMLALAQCPHHGAEGNFKNSFWKIIKREYNTPIVISVGTNIYGHPAEKVVNYLLKSNYNIFSTNKVGALSNTKIDSKAKEISSYLDIFGRIVSLEYNDKYNGDKIFEIDSLGIVNSIF